VPIAVNILNKLRDAGCEVALKVNPSDVVKMSVASGAAPPGTEIIEAHEQSYLKTGIKLTRTASKLLSPQADEEPDAV
jgi:hypothetical protein